ncbi:hypothetical protein T265_14032, partial [Opisthorchis viverrini]
SLLPLQAVRLARYHILTPNSPTSRQLPHHRKVLHDIRSPENLLLASRSRDAPIKIADFGLAVQTTDNQPRRHGLAGTYVYMAPEVIREIPYNNAVDVWSCGVILYLLLAGYPPFMDRDDDRLQRKILTTRHTYPPNEWSLITRAAKDLIDRMLERDPSRRISAAAALQHPWLRERARVASDIHLREAVDHLKQFNARRKFKAAVVTTMLANRQLKAVRRENDGKSFIEPGFGIDRSTLDIKANPHE